MMRGVFVAGTDTEVGKTVVSAALLLALRRRGLPLRYRKPVSSDGHPHQGRLLSPDALWVHRLAPLEPPAAMNPVCLPHALSPLAAARLEGMEPDWAELTARVRASLADGGPFLCEGVGGLMVPLCAGRTALDLMAELGLPVVVVARPGLGTINHTLLTVETLRARGLAVLGFVFSGREEDDGRGAVGALNHQLIAEFGAVPFLGALPRLEPKEMDAPGLARAAEEHLELAPLAQALAD